MAKYLAIHIPNYPHKLMHIFRTTQRRAARGKEQEDCEHTLGHGNTRWGMGTHAGAWEHTLGHGTQVTSYPHSSSRFRLFSRTWCRDHNLSSVEVVGSWLAELEQPAVHVLPERWA